MNQPTVFNEQQSHNQEAIQEWLIAQLAERLEIDPEDIDIQEPFDSYDLSSAQALILLGKLEKWLGHNFNPVLIFNYPTVEQLAQRLAEETSLNS